MVIIIKRFYIIIFVFIIMILFILVFSNHFKKDTNYVILITVMDGQQQSNNLSLEEAINLINKLPFQNADIFFNGTLVLDSMLIPKKDNITIRGSGKDSAVLDFGSSINGQLFFDGRRNITLEDFSIKSENGKSVDRILFNDTDLIKICNIKLNGGGQIWHHFTIYFNTGNSNITLCNIDTNNTEDSPIRFFNKKGLNKNRNIIIENYHNHGIVHAVTGEGYEGGDGIDLYGAQNVTIDNYSAENLDGNGIGIYADAKNIKGNNIYLNNIGGNNHTGSCIGISRWDDKDPSDIYFRNISINECRGHGIHLFTQPLVSHNNKNFGKISNITISNLSINRVWWSGIALEGGVIVNISITDFYISDTNLNKKKSPVIFLNANFTNILLDKGKLLFPFIMPKQKKGVIFQNVTTI